MTILEAIQSNPVFSDLDESTIQFALSNRSVDGSVTYSSNYLKDVELVSADLYLDILLIPEFKEGQLSVKYDTSLLKSRAKSIYEKYDDPKLSEVGPKQINLTVNPVE